MIRVIFMGSPQEVVAPLRLLTDQAAANNLDVVAVVSQPARPVGRGGQVADPPVAAFAKLQKLKCLQPESAKSPDFLAELRSLRPDIIVTAAYGQILSEEFLAIPALGTINIHPSQLPRYRGATPVPAALLDGLSETAVTILFTVKKLDAGNIIEQKTFEILPDETAGHLTDRLFSLSGPMLIDAIQKVAEQPGYKGSPQNDAEVTYCRKIDKEMGEVDWSLSADEIVNRFRAFEPWPGTWTAFQGRRVAITAMTKSETPGAAARPGSMVFDKSKKIIIAQCGAGGVGITRLKPAGGKDMDSASFWNGIKDKSGSLYFGGGSQ